MQDEKNREVEFKPQESRDASAAEAQSSIAQLADQFYRKRKGRNLTLGQTSQQIGVSTATLSRFERQRLGGPLEGGQGSFVPDTRTLAAISSWLGTSLSTVVVGETIEKSANRIAIEESIPDKIELHLRADPNLSNEAATTLSQLFRLAYSQVARTKQRQKGVPNHDEHSEAP